MNTNTIHTPPDVVPASAYARIGLPPNKFPYCAVNARITDHELLADWHRLSSAAWRIGILTGGPCAVCGTQVTEPDPESGLLHSILTEPVFVLLSVPLCSRHAFGAERYNNASGTFTIECKNDRFSVTLDGCAPVVAPIVLSREKLLLIMPKTAGTADGWMLDEIPKGFPVIRPLFHFENAHFNNGGVSLRSAVGDTVVVWRGDGEQRARALAFYPWLPGEAYRTGEDAIALKYVAKAALSGDAAVVRFNGLNTMVSLDSESTACKGMEREMTRWRKWVRNRPAAAHAGA
jgi:hypothetical protein